MEFEIEGTLKLPTLYFDDEKLVVKERDGSKKVYAYTDMSHFELSYKQMFANFATFSFQYQKKSIVIPYNKPIQRKERNDYVYGKGNSRSNPGRLQISA